MTSNNPEPSGIRRGNAGFSLIELLVVMIVLGVVAAIVVWAIGGTRGDAHKSMCKSSVHSIVLAAEAFKVRGDDTYPAAQSQLISPSVHGMLQRWPGGTNPAKDDLVYAYSQNAAHGFRIAITGKAVTGSHIVNGDNSGDPAVSAACAVD